MKLQLNDFPQLRLLTWNLGDGNTVEESEAFSIYERNWRFVDQVHLEDTERALIVRLTNQFGCGVVNV
jgi:hypothetical protein